MTDQSLTKERNVFLLGFLLLTIVGQLVGWVSTSVGERWTAVLVTLLAKAALTYLVFRLSRFLKQRWWQTGLYCVLSPFSILYLVPFVGLLVGVRHARRRLDVTSEPSVGDTWRATKGGTVMAALGKVIQGAGVLVFAVTGLWGFFLCLAIINEAAGFWGIVVGLFIAPVTFLAAPLWAGFTYGNWFPLVLEYGGGLCGGLLVALGGALAGDE